MAWQPPPLAAIRVFEAAARLGSFTKAADELGMTQAAVSYQIKVLEERLETALFERKVRQVTLTEAGVRLAPRASEAFSILSDAWLSAQGSARGVLTISPVQTFASNWLAVRLGGFQLMHPELAVKLEPTNRVIDLSREDIDIGIRTGAGEWPGLVSHYLFRDDYTPMLSPKLAESVGGIRTPDDLYKLTLLGPDDPWWSNWFEAAGQRFEPERMIPGPILGAQIYEAVAAVAGQGAAMLTRNLYTQFIEGGQLIQPFETIGSDSGGYWLVYAESRRNVPKIRTFRDWVLAETATIREMEQNG